MINPSQNEVERIDLAGAEDLRDVVHRAVACLAQGGTVALPSEPAYFVLGSALRPEAMLKFNSLLRDLGHSQLAICLKGPSELMDWIPDLSALGSRIALRAWPGPVQLRFPINSARGLTRLLPSETRELAERGDSVSFLVPRAPMILDILALVPGPLMAVETRSLSTDQLARSAGLQMLLDDGSEASKDETTVVRIADDQWSIERPGLLSEKDIARMVGTLILFVCTGNTCRSPMAEALCKMLLAAALKCGLDDLPSRGFVVESAGLAASAGQPAAREAIEVVNSRGGSLDDHASRQISLPLVARADLVFAMTRDHQDALLAHAPEAADRIRMLDPDGADIDDPIGSDRKTYQNTAKVVERHLKKLLDELLSDRMKKSS